MSAGLHDPDYGPRVEVLLVNHHTAAETLALVRSLPPGFAARVLENGSGPNEIEALRHGGLEPLASVENLGFARGVNRLAAGARAPWLLLVNPDLEPGPGLFDRVLKRLPLDPAIGIVGGVRSGEGPRAHGAFPGLLDRFLPAPLPLAGPGPCDVDWVSGCFMLVRRAVFAELGGMDEGYFMQMEDVDFCWRARQRGHRAVVEPAFAFAHRGHLSYARCQRPLVQDVRAGKVRFLQQSGRPLAAAALRVVHSLLWNRL